MKFWAPFLFSLWLSAGMALADAREDFDLGRQAQRLGAMKAAVVYYTRAIESGELGGFNLAIVYSNRGNALSDLGEYQLALQDHNEAVRLNPQDASALYNRGRVYGYLGERDMAIQQFQRALEINPKLRAAKKALKSLGLKP